MSVLFCSVFSINDINSIVCDGPATTNTVVAIDPYYSCRHQYLGFEQSMMH